ncbi:hypothetical protein [Methyloradius palustris]|uniref:Uncharacterized protein n=1 Tax=Methyloradius palustris TaxID=2778876 RepID=A0A8D5JRD8_9PROT|nr:hypothetical protein [Methyloradius palustris]BCM25376.1 hypothetical protein ZMTM_16350 [Methyloradius palustris]
MKGIATLFLLLNCLTGCFSVKVYDSPQVNGYVSSKQTGQPVNSAEVSVEQHPELITQTDKAGNFVLQSKVRRIWCAVMADSCMFAWFMHPINVLIKADGYQPINIYQNPTKAEAERGLNLNVELTPE